MDRRLVLAFEGLFDAVAALTADALMPGDIVWSGAATRNGALLANGQAVSRTTYAALFAAIGTTYGVGDGSTTFNVPNVADVGGISNTAFIVY